MFYAIILSIIITGGENMENEKIFELMTKMYSEMQHGFKSVREEMNDIKGDVSTLKEDVSELKNKVRKIDIKLEEVDKKIDLSIEGHKTNTEQPGRIEKEVAKHEEFILKRVK